ncbi:MAG: uncharacterized protein A8A55_3638, partial [Amphiamblys sp. WSBS2006]
KELSLNTYAPEYFGGITRTENNSIWVGKVSNLILSQYGAGILPKLRFHEENEVEKFGLEADEAEHITEILKEERKSIWMGKMRQVAIVGYAAEMLPKLRFHGENVMEEFEISAGNAEHIAG